MYKTTALLAAAAIFCSGCAQKASDAVSTTSLPAPAASAVSGNQNMGTAISGKAPASPISQDVKKDVASLKDSIEMTLRHYRGFKVIQANREAAQYDVKVAKAGWGPKVDLTAGFGVNYLSNSTTRSLGTDTGVHPTGNFGVVLTQPLWDGYATRSRVNASIATVDSLTYRVLDNANSFALDAIIAHIDLNRRREIVRLAEDNVKRHRSMVGQQHERVNMGAGSSADVTQTQVKLARARATLSDAQAALREAESEYQRLTGAPAPAVLEPVTMPAGMYPDMEKVTAQAVKTNPKLNAYFYDVEASKQKKELAKAAYHPVLNLEIGGSYSDRDGNGYGSPQYAREADAMLKMRWNLFNSGADRNAVRAADSRIRESRETVYTYISTLNTEIENTWTRYLASQKQRDYYDQAIKYGKQTRYAYMEQFNLGVRSLSDILDVDSELFNSQTEQVTAASNVLVGAYRLYALAGELLPSFKIDDSLIMPPSAVDLEKSKGTRD